MERGISWARQARKGTNWGRRKGSSWQRSVSWGRATLWG